MRHKNHKLAKMGKPTKPQSAPEYTTARIFGEDDLRIARIAEILASQTKGAYPKCSVISIALDALEDKLKAEKAAA